MQYNVINVFEMQIYAKKFSAGDSLQYTGGLDSAIQKDSIEKGEIYDVNADH